MLSDEEVALELGVWALFMAGTAHPSGFPAPQPGQSIHQEGLGQENDALDHDWSRFFHCQDAVYKALQDFGHELRLLPQVLCLGVSEPDRGLLSSITNEVAPYSQVDLRDLVEIIESASGKQATLGAQEVEICGVRGPFQDSFRLKECFQSQLQGAMTWR